MSGQASESSAARASTSATQSFLSLRLVEADHVLSKPSPGLDDMVSPLTGRQIDRVPILRLFGTTKQGQKTCMHVHGVFPYFLIPWPQSKEPPSKEVSGDTPLTLTFPQELKALAAAIETAVNGVGTRKAQQQVATCNVLSSTACTEWHLLS